MTLPDWFRKDNVFDVEPLRGPLFGCLLRSAGQVSCSAYTPYFGAAHLEYGSLLGAGDEAEKLPPQLEMGLAAQEQLAESNEARDMQNGA